MALRALVRPMLARVPTAHATRMTMRPSYAALAPVRSFAASAADSSAAAASPATASFEEDEDASPLDARMQFTTQPLDRDGNPVGGAKLLRTAGPLDPRHFRLPNASFIMVRVNARHKYNKKIITGGPSSRKNTRGAPVVEVADAPREKDPYLVAFRVPLNYNKLQIRNYLEEIYKIDVVDVRTMIYLGKERRNYRTGLREKRSDYKKAYVRLLHPFPYPTLEEQRKMSTGLTHEPQPLPVAPVLSAEQAAREAEQAEIARVKAEQDRIQFEARERVRKQVEENLKTLEHEQAQKSGIRGNR